MRRSNTKRLFISAHAVLFACASLAAQAPSVVRVQALGPTTQDWLNSGVESRNGRFYAFSSYHGETLAMYDARRRSWTSFPDVVIGQQLAWSPDGRFLASVRPLPGGRGRYIWLTPIDTATGRPSAPSRRVSTRVGAFPSWSADARRLAFVNNDSGTVRIVVAPFNGGDEEVLFAEPGRGSALAWSADGETIFAMLGARGFEEWLRLDVASRRSRRMPAGSPWPFVGLSPDGRRVASYNPQQSQLTVASTLDGRVEATHQIPPLLNPSGWSRDGTGWIAAERVVPSHIEQVRVADGAITSLTAPESVALGDVRHSPDGAQLLYARALGTTTQLLVIPARGGTPRTLGAPQRTPIGNYAWSPSGAMVVYCTSTEVHVIDVTRGADRALARVVAGARSPRPQCRWRSDGRAIRWLQSPGGNFAREHAVHETSLASEDRVIARFTAPGLPYLLDDTLVVVPDTAGLRLRHLSTGKERLAYRGEASTRAPEWTPDGRSLLFVIVENGNYVPYVLDVASGTGRKVPYTLGGELASVRFHPDGRHLVAYACISCVSPAWVEKWDVVLIPMNGGAARVLTASQKTYKDHGAPSIAPDGATIAFVGEETYLTRVTKLVPSARNP